MTTAKEANDEKTPYLIYNIRQLLYDEYGSPATIAGKYTEGSLSNSIPISPQLDMYIERDNSGYDSRDTWEMFCIFLSCLQ